MQSLKAAFLKLWSADHLWSLWSALEVLKKIQMNWIAEILEFGNGTWQSPFNFSLCTDILWNLLPYLSTHFPTLLSETKEGFKALWTWCFSSSFLCTSVAAPITRQGPPVFVIEDQSIEPLHVFKTVLIVLLTPSLHNEMIMYCTL